MEALRRRKTLDNRSRPLDRELEVFHSTGLPSISALENVLTANVRAALDK
jgi:hypothetical protein